MMIDDPDFIHQSGEKMSPAQQKEWFRAHAAEMRAEGATFFRATVHDTIAHLLLLEGWKVPPDDQGEVRWQFAPSASSDGGVR
jgi:hypothetical protein